VCVVLAAGGYPGAYEKGRPITGLDQVDEGVLVFHAGTARGGGGEILTAGGRVLGVTALGDSHEEAREKALANAARIGFDGVQYRKDIGLL
jgi:phosphoribosylamine--glycine ligase